MGLDIRSKSGLHFHIGYGQFTFMRMECCNQILPGLGQFYEWTTNPFGCLRGMERNADFKYELLCDATVKDFQDACCQLLATYLNQRGMFKDMWSLLICHSDCEGKLTAKQCGRLVADLDRIEPGPIMGEKFKEFRNLLHEASKRNETLYFG